MTPRHCIVIGDEGWIGRSLIIRLLKLGNWIVRIIDSPPFLADQNSIVCSAVNDGRAFYVQVDVCDKSQVVIAIQGTSVVFYIDYSDSNVGNYYKCYMHIVQGAKNVINACLECNVERLIYNSTSDVVFNGFQAIHYADESLQYPWKYLDMLNDLRAQAESLVLSANRPNGILTCSLFPGNVFGPSDTLVVPSLINQANSSLTKFILGNGDNMCDFTYVENVAHSHMCAAEPQVVDVAGKAFFITNLEPMHYWEFVSRIYKGLGYQRPIIKFTAWIPSSILLLLNWLRDQLESEHSQQLLLTQFFIQSALFTRTFSCTAAEEHLGYSPIVSLDEGIALTLKKFPHSSKEKHPIRYIHLTNESKAEKLLKCGNVADILLWRNEKKTFTWFLAMALLFYWFFLGETTFIASTARLLLLMEGFPLCSKLPSIIYIGVYHSKSSLVNIQIPDSGLRATIVMMDSFWKKGLVVSRSLTDGENWSIFLKALIPLYILNLIFSISSCCTFLGLAMVFSLSSFFIYEQYEEEVDGFMRIVTILLRNLKMFLSSKLLESVSSYVFEDKELCGEYTPTSKVYVKMIRLAKFLQSYPMLSNF